MPTDAVGSVEQGPLAYPRPGQDGKRNGGLWDGHPNPIAAAAERDFTFAGTRRLWGLLVTLARELGIETHMAAELDRRHKRHTEAADGQRPDLADASRQREIG